MIRDNRVLLIVLFCVIYCVAQAQRPANEIEISEYNVDTLAQRDLIDIGKRLLKIKPPKDADSEGKNVYFSFLPFSTTVPGDGSALITTTTAGFYLGDRENTHMSRATFAPYTNFGQRYGFPIRSYMWLSENKWVIDGDIRLLKYPHDTWGTGRQHKADDYLRLDYTYLRFYQHALKRVKGGLFFGLGYDLDYRMNIHSRDEISLAEYTGYPYGTDRKDKTVSSGISFNTIYDTRANSINPWDGIYANLQFRVNPTFLGSDNNWQSMFFEVRKYHRFTQNRSRQHMLATRTMLWTVFDSKAPYLDLPNLGWDPYNSSGRGLPPSRLRGKTLFYFESEYRKDITRNGLLGFVVFTNMTTVSGPKSNLFLNWNLAGGAGARIKFNKNSGTNIAIDYGVSAHDRGFRVSLGEVF